MGLIIGSRQESALLSLGPGGWGQGVWWSFQYQHPWEGTPGKPRVLMVSFCVLPHGLVGVWLQHWAQFSWDPDWTREQPDIPRACCPEGDQGRLHLFQGHRGWGECCPRSGDREEASTSNWENEECFWDSGQKAPLELSLLKMLILRGAKRSYTLVLCMVSLCPRVSVVPIKT